MTVIMHIHDPGCKFAQDGNGNHEDAARRVSDSYNLHLLADKDGNQGRFLAFQLADGTGDGTAYASREDAIRGQHHNEKYCMFVPIRRTSMTVCQAATLLRSARMMYDLGNPQIERQVIIPRLTNEHQAKQMRRLQAQLNRRG
jgi:hypothetical protein